MAMMVGPRMGGSNVGSEEGETEEIWEEKGKTYSHLRGHVEFYGNIYIIFIYIYIERWI